MDPSAPATQADIARLEENIRILRSEMNHQYDDVKEGLRDMQTELLKAFYSFAQTTDVRLKEV